MNAILEKIENSEAYLEFVIEAEKMEAGLHKSYRKNRKKYQVSGFRKGEAPRTVIESKYGPAAFLEDALELVVPDEYYGAIRALGIDTIGDPDIEVGYVEKGKPVNVKVRVPVKPEVILGELEGLKIEVPEADQVTEADVENYLQGLRSQHKLVTVKEAEPAVHGDTVIFAYQCTIDDAPFEEQEDFKLELGSDTFYPGFEEKITGVKAGDELELEIKLPEDLVPQLAGKSAQFKVRVKQVERIALRDLDDQFARELGKVESMEKMRIEARQILQEMAAQRVAAMARERAVKALMEKSQVSVPEFLVMQQAQGMLEQFNQNLAAQGGTVEMYLQMTNSDLPTFKKQLWEEAKLIVESNYVLEKVIEEKQIGLSDEELEHGIEVFAASIGMEKANAKANLGPMVDRVKFDLKAEKAVQYLVEHALMGR